VTAAGAGVPAGIPVSGMAGDQQAALFGQACLEPGMTKNTYGTGSFVLMHVGDRCPAPVEGLLTTVGWTLADGTTAYALEGAIFVTGAAVQWLRDGLGIIESADEIAALAATVPDTEGCFLVPAFTGLGSPWWDPYARGTVVGITRGTGRGHLARAVLESISLQTRDVVLAMSDASGYPIRALKADGGAAANDLLLQLQADDLQVPVSRPVVQETTALGAAYLAGLAEGVWSSTDDLAANWRLDATFEPLADPAAVDARHTAWRRAVERSRGWAST
jgi:glycerol kinase